MLLLIIVLRIQKLSFVVSHRVPYWVNYFLYCMLIISQSNISNILDFILFADGTTILYSHEDINSKINMLNEELQEVNNWFKANKCQ